MCTQFEEKPTVHLGSKGCLGLPLSVAEFDKVWTQFKEKTAIYLGSLVWTPDPPTSN